MKCGKDREKARKSGKPGYFISYLFSLVLDVFAAIVSLAPTGGEGRREGARVDAEPYRRCSSGAREDGFSADGAGGARRPPHPTLSPDGGEGESNAKHIHRSCKKPVRLLILLFVPARYGVTSAS
jgi:hypothetical protein